MGISMKVKTKKKYGLEVFAIGNNDLDLNIFICLLVTLSFFSYNQLSS